MFNEYINNTNISINEVYYSDRISKNLISVGKLIQQNYKLVLSSNNNTLKLIIYKSHGKRITHVTSNSSNTFKIWMSRKVINLNTNNFNTIKEFNSITLKPSEKLDLWHQRFGNFNIDNIKTKLLKIKIPAKCPICSNSKLKNKSHKLSTNKS